MLHPEILCLTDPENIYGFLEEHETQGICKSFLEEYQIQGICRDSLKKIRPMEYKGLLEHTSDIHVFKNAYLNYLRCRSS